MDTPLRLTAIAEMVSPFLCDDLFLVLWNTMATARAVETVDATFVKQDRDEKQAEANEEVEELDTHELSLEDTRKRASALANLVLQERVRLVITFWQTLSLEEQSVLLKSFQSHGEGDRGERDAKSDASKLKSVLRALEETYMAEQIHHRRQATRHNLSIAPARGFANLQYQPVAPQLPGSGPQFRRPTVTVRNRLKSNFAFMNHQARPPPRNSLVIVDGGSRAVTTDGGPDHQAISIPDVLLGVIVPHPSDTSSRFRTKVVAVENLSIDQLRGAHEAILRKCEDIFDLLCDDEELEAVGDKRTRPKDEGSDQSSQLVSAPESAISEAKGVLCDLLCAYLEPTDRILDKFTRSEDARERQRCAKLELDDGSGTNALVQTIIQRQKENPSLLVNAINQSPEILLSAIAQNLGILRFTITKFAGPVKRFLKLDPKACDHLDALVQKNRGVQLLWGTNTSTSDTVMGVGGNTGFEEYLVAAGTTGVTVGGSYLVDWFASHTIELSAHFLGQPELLKQLFIDMHQRADVSSFYRLMLQLQSVKGVQNFMLRASVATLERIAQEDPGEILRLLHEVFHEDPVSGPNRDLLDQLRTSQYLVTCLSEFHPTALQDILSSHIDTWKHYFVDTAASNDAILRESLLLRVFGALLYSFPWLALLTNLVVVGGVWPCRLRMSKVVMRWSRSLMRSWTAPRPR